MLATRLALLYFLASAAMLVAPLYDRLGNHIEPRVFGHPWSLVYVLTIVGSNFLVLALAYWARLPGDSDSEDVPPA